jgi:hypothetical protein
MSTIITRAGKGSPLENSELDSNFTNLNTDKLEINDALGTPASVTLTNATGLPTAGLVDNAVTNEKLRDSAGLSVIGRGANSTGDPADIVAGTNKQVLRRDGSSLGFGAVDLSSNQAVTGTLPVNQGGTGITSFGSGVATWLGTPSSANLAAAVTDETGTGALVFANSPTLVTPALGTPASGVVTNLTGTASININGTVGATTPAAGAFTTLNTSGAVVFNEAGANVDFRVEGDTEPNLLFVDASADNVGIGTSSPFTKTDSAAARATTLNSIASFNTMALSVTDTTAFAVGVGGGINFRAQLTASTYSTYASIWSFRESAVTNDFKGSLIFGTADNTDGYPEERMRINSSGNVGIGTTFPDANLTVNGAASFAAGTALLPSIARAGDLNTGFWFPAADTIAASTAGSERLRINSDGRLLHNSTIAYTTYGSVTPSIQQHGTTDATGWWGAYRWSNNAAGNEFVFNKSRGGSIGTHTIVSSGDTLGKLTFAGSNGTTFDAAAYIAGLSGGTPGASADMPGALVFATSADGSATPTERMRITSAGLVGIGTSSPTQKLTVNGNVAVGGQQAFIYRDDDGFSGTSARRAWATTANFDAFGTLSFKVSTAANTAPMDGTTVVAITSAGDVLIGKTTATANGGDLQVSSGITFPATQVPKSDANTLDDYEEGTFTPVLTGSTSGTFNGSGKYTKIGDVVNVFMQFAEITTGNKPIGDYTVTGLPFTSRATMPDATPLTIGGFARVTFDASKIQASAINANSTTVVVNELTSNGLTTALTDANFVNGSNMFFRISGSYPTST